MTLADTPVLSIANLSVSVRGEDGERNVVSNLSLTLARGETLCIAGESGSGKSMTALAIMQLLPQPAARISSGMIRLRDGNRGDTDLATLDERQMRRIRGDRIAMIFQEPMTSLNPVLSIGRQLTESIEAHTSLSSAQARQRAIEALKAVRISEAESRLKQFPHELSGGMRQRVMIAMALALEPDVLIADEPTTALDVTVQGEVLELLRDLQRQHGTSVILITHDMGVVAEMADRVIVMRDGRMVEEGTTSDIFARPQADYTRELLAAVPRIGSGVGRQKSRDAIDVLKPANVAEVNDLHVRFDLRGGIFGRVTRRVHAVEGVSFSIAPNETLALVGESGCGKSTTAKALAGLAPYSGDIVIGGRNLSGLGRDERKAVRRDVQMIFQDPFASLDPRMRVGELVAEPLVIHGIASKDERRERVGALFERVGLSADQMELYPHEFSGGQRQRVCIARALALRPKLIIADESVSALDVSVQARVLDLLKELQREFGVAYLFISHDMAVVENISDRVAVMYLGQIVEMGTRDQVFSNPRHPYTRRLIDAVPVPDPAQRRTRFARLDQEIPSATRRIGEAPLKLALNDVGGGHLVAAES
ncbi:MULTISPECIES: ABC transporter ATP-binding protein [unclassified Mesorhizobium]|uniref:ABC transporter ATP-binding protein n=1 Tax=unclassified Mesorhizobium TaxID=325217 RepID=UPI0003CDF28C|nr:MULTISPECIES: ABC transporter ATP-binding protein [unclassified Mesorhizobium]ESX03995.1 ABC transporter ATP-binding protein [Mesorhizobium sp. LSJC265A00]ESX26011.1 ABC transporter ATP-binding protein [Mesorhizobium sp. LSJC264A00]ESY11077.1 ABC transporter ATP-binding protein [Mesorhizobium sp. LNJC398B00]ESY34369.1 ABC transporter ATP-binding protein [Mesorhizobium sp. LNJC386A00]ESZ56610.1 ABC transporter ATP-binding protein [Mesorhizobium sp. L103C131B0]